MLLRKTRLGISGGVWICRLKISAGSLSPSVSDITVCSEVADEIGSSVSKWGSVAVGWWGGLSCFGVVSRWLFPGVLLVCL